MRGRFFTLALMLAPVAAHAAVCAVDERPAATLLVPYFEHDYASACTPPGARGHSLSWRVHNASDASQLGRITLWSQAGVPVLDFYLYLHARQSRQVLLADILCRGVLPRTGPSLPGSRFGGSPSSFPQCGNGLAADVPPNYSTPLDAARLAEVRAALTGKSVAAAGGCYGPDAGDDIARGYLTLDDVGACSAEPPDSAAYATTGLGFDNAWLGAWEQTGLLGNIGVGGAMLALEAAPAGYFGAGQATFHGRLTDYSGVDRREPLPSTWAAPFAQGGSPARIAGWVAWREAPRLAPSPALCGGATPGGELPLESREQRAFDGGGRSQGAPQAPPAAVGLAAQRLPVDGIESTATIAFAGTRGLGYGNFADSGADARAGQAWLGALSLVDGRFGDLLPGTALDSRCTGTAPADVRGPLAALPLVRSVIFGDSYEE